MKITSVDIIDVANDFASATSKWRPVVVKINTDEGISGFGEVGLAYGVGASAGIGMAKDLAAIIIGMDPMNNEAIWEKMLKKTFWGPGRRRHLFRCDERHPISRCGISKAKRGACRCIKCLAAKAARK
ncbi:mandelate racemase [Salmonella enterica subsp. enterica]|nr:mandelate racemase [Salmonella enterica subsp. enterica]